MQANSKLLIKKMPWHANFTEKGHLSRALLAKPHMMEGAVRRMFSSLNYSENPLTAIATNIGAVTEIGNDEWTWMLRGASVRPSVWTGLPINTPQGNLGQEFEIPVSENFWVAGDIVHPGNPEYQVRVQRNAERRGSNWVYRVALVNTDQTKTIPSRYLQRGVAWSKLYSKYEEGSEQSGSTTYALPVTLRSKLSRLRKHFTVTGDAHDEVLAVGLVDPKDGTKYRTWFKYAEKEFWMQWYREMEMNNWYSRSNNRLAGSTGRVVDSGPGIQELLEDSQRHVYSKFTGKLLEEFLMDVSYGRISPGASRKFRVFTGEYGMLLINRAAKNMLGETGLTILDSHFIEKASSTYHSNALSFGGQFTHLKLSNGIEVDVVHNPLYDDRTIHTDIDPETGYPYESMRMTFLDFGTDNAESNIKIVKRTGAMKLRYVDGMTSPFGDNVNTRASHAGDYYEMHVHDKCGVQIDDVTACGELIAKRA